MPSKFIVRDFSENSYYHIYNIGIEKRDIFQDEKDYNFFLTYIIIYLSNPKVVLDMFPDLPFRLRSKNLSKEVEIIGFCLKPNHFHLILKQKTIDGISKFMKQLINAYTMFFNQRHDHSGALMQGRYKAVKLPDELVSSLLRYIHLDPIRENIQKIDKTKLLEDLKNYKWSSFSTYLGQENILTINKQFITNKFKTTEALIKYHQDIENYQNEQLQIANFTIESD